MGGACRAGWYGLRAMRPWGGALSSAILYVAIVAIWAVVLVPRWLRLQTLAPPQAVPDPAPAPDEAVPSPDEMAPSPEPAAPPQPAVAGAASEVAPQQPARERPAWNSARARLAYVTAGQSRAERHARILRSRRRMLATLALLTAVATGIALLRLAPRWVAIPPAFMLAGLLVLLREAAHSDSERAHRRSLAARAHSPFPADDRQDSRHRTGPAWAPATAPPGAAAGAMAGEGRGTGEFPEVSAQIIDISARMQDQLYDQYTDAAERAVGD